MAVFQIDFLASFCSFSTKNSGSFSNRFPGKHLDRCFGGEEKVIREGSKERCSKRGDRQKIPRITSCLIHFLSDDLFWTQHKSLMGHQLRKLPCLLQRAACQPSQHVREFRQGPVRSYVLRCESMMRIPTREVAVVEIMLTPAPLTSQHRCIVIPIHLCVVLGRPDSQFIVVYCCILL